MMSVTGGIDSAAVVSNGGTVLLVTGGTDSGVTVLNGGQEIVSSGGAASGTILSSGGLQVLSSGGTASGTKVKSGGVLTRRGRHRHRRGGLRRAARCWCRRAATSAPSCSARAVVTVLAGGQHQRLDAAGRRRWRSLSVGRHGERRDRRLGRPGERAVGRHGQRHRAELGRPRNGVRGRRDRRALVVSIDGLEIVSAGGLALGTIVSFERRHRDRLLRRPGERRGGAVERRPDGAEGRHRQRHDDQQWRPGTGVVGRRQPPGAW